MRSTLPTAGSLGQYRLAKASFTIQTSGASSRSADVKLRPARIGIPIARKKSVLTCERGTRT
jgi:hypothetical protein